MRRVDSLEKTDAVRDWGQEEKGTTEDEMAGWHPRAPGWGRQHHSQRETPFVPGKRLPDWASLELSGEPGVSGDFWGSQEGCQVL